MDNVLRSLFFWVGIVAVACYVLTLLTRRFVEALISRFKEPWHDRLVFWWREAFLYLVGPAWGWSLAMSLRDTASFPVMFREKESAGVFGIALGFLAGFFYKLLKKVIEQKTGVSLPSSDSAASEIPEPPEASEDPPPTTPSEPSEKT